MTRPSHYRLRRQVDHRAPKETRLSGPPGYGVLREDREPGDARAPASVSLGVRVGKSDGNTQRHQVRRDKVTARAHRRAFYGSASRRTSGTDETGYEPLSEREEEVDIDARKRSWARLLAKVSDVDPFMCPKCGAEMKVIAIIEDPEELKRILRHLVKIGRSPPGFEPDRLN